METEPSNPDTTSKTYSNSNLTEQSNVWSMSLEETLGINGHQQSLEANLEPTVSDNGFTEPSDIPTELSNIEEFINTEETPMICDEDEEDDLALTIVCD